MIAIMNEFLCSLFSLLDGQTLYLLSQCSRVSNHIELIHYSIVVLQIEEFASDLSKYFQQCYQMKDTQNTVRNLAIVLSSYFIVGSRGVPGLSHLWCAFSSGAG